MGHDHIDMVLKSNVKFKELTASLSSRDYKSVYAYVRKMLESYREDNVKKLTHRLEKEVLRDPRLMGALGVTSGPAVTPLRSTTANPRDSKLSPDEYEASWRR